jgi:phosphatidylglycerol lysyltransferase
MSETGGDSPPHATGTPKKRSLWKRLEPWVVLLVFFLACWLLYREMRKYRWDDVVAGLESVAKRRLWSCVGLTALSYLILIGYDLLAVWAVGHPLPLRRVALASFVGFAVSYNFGALLGGTPVRYRLYSSWGLTASEIVRLFVMMGVTFWVGVMALAGVVFLVHPFPVPEEVTLPFETVRPLGGILLLLSAGYVALAVLFRNGLTIRGRRFDFPTARITVLQLIVSAVDLVVAAGCLYVLVAPEIPLTFVEFLGVYLLAVVAVVLSHVPGGMGVFELLVIKFCQTESATLPAALLVFRVVYYLIPLLLAGGLLAAHEFVLKHPRGPRGGE